jgi:hypothetical protein
MPQLIEMDRVVSYLHQKGFLKHQSPAAMPRADLGASLQRRFDEAWFYARLRKTTAKLGSLPEDLEREALDLAAESWPVSFMLARYYARARDSRRADALANQFAALVDKEPDADRLAYYRGDIHGMATRIARACEPETANRVGGILASRFSMGTLDGDNDVSD